MGPYIRIALRYLAGALVARGLLTPDVADQLATDPDVFMIATQAVNWVSVALGAALAGIVEWAYGKARKLGWAT